MTSSEISMWTCSLVEYSTKRKLQSTRWGGDMSLTRLLPQPIHWLLREYVKPHPIGSLFWSNTWKFLFLSKIRKGGWMHVLLQSLNYGFLYFTDSTQKPGPGAHSPEKVELNKPAAPKFSLGIRHSEFVTPLIIDVTD